MTKEEVEQLRKKALAEIVEEDRRKEINRIKLEIRTRKPIWARIFPFKIKIERI